MPLTNRRFPRACASPRGHQSGCDAADEPTEPTNNATEPLSDGGGDHFGVSTPSIVAALRSHSDGLDEAERACKGLEDEVKAWGGRPNAALRHRAEQVEVRLTDQLLQLTRMLDDCATSEGRNAVKRSVARLKALGARLLRISQGR